MPLIDAMQDPGLALPDGTLEAFATQTRRSSRDAALVMARCAVLSYNRQAGQG